MDIRVKIANTPEEKREQRLAQLLRQIEICQEMGYGDTYIQPYANAAAELILADLPVWEVAA